MCRWLNGQLQEMARAQFEIKCSDILAKHRHVTLAEVCSSSEDRQPDMPHVSSSSSLSCDAKWKKSYSCHSP